MPEIVQWVYRTGAVESPLPCGEVCEQLWTASHAYSSLQTVSATRLWQEIADVELGLGMWGDLTSLRSQLAGAELATTQLRVGWHIDDGSAPGPGEKWMEIVGPHSPGGGCGWRTNLRLEGEGVGISFFVKPVAHEDSWFLVGCNGLSEDVANYVEHVIKPEGLCAPLLAAPPTFSGWQGEEFHWNQCGEEVGPKVPEVEMFSAVYHAPFLFAPVGPWTHQHLTGPGTINVETNTASDPGEAAVKAGIEAQLEHQGLLSGWVNWVLGGFHGADPAGTFPAEAFGSGNEAMPNERKCLEGFPVNCASGDQTETQDDLRLGGRGPALEWQRTYNSQLARTQASHGSLGYGWTASYSAHVEGNEELGLATVFQDNGSAVRFVHAGTGWTPIGSSSVEATLAPEAGGYVYTLPNQSRLHFNAEGLLTSKEDRNGNALTMSRGTGGRLETVTDAAGRKLKLAYNVEGLLESVTDPMSHVAKYAYEDGNLLSVTEPGEASPRWQFKYDASHQLTSETDGRGGVVTTEYDESGRAIAQTDPIGRKRKWEYTGTSAAPETTITQPNGSATVEKFTASGQPLSVTRASGSAIATTTQYEYDAAGNLAALIDPNGHTTTYQYDAAGDQTGRTDPDGDTIRWTFNEKHQELTEISPRDETTTFVRDAHGNVLSVSKPILGEEVQVSKFKYAANGDLESTTDPLGHVWKYEYDSFGDRSAEIDPEADKRTWSYDGDSRETSTVSPRGHATGAKEAKFTTSIERDAQGRPIKLTDALKHETKYAYDANGDLESETDPIGNVTSYLYDADDEGTKVKRPSGVTVETEYDSSGRVVAQVDGSKHTTKYVRNALGEVTEVVDPLGRKTLKEYDAAGNLKSLTDAAKRTTTYAYDPADRMTSISYSDGVTPEVKYEYDADGERTEMIDGTGTSTYAYDHLDRLTESKDGHGESVGYEYNLANQQTKITYPSGKSVSRSYDTSGRLESVTDWLGHVTKFAYDADSDQASTTFPSATGDVDQYAYENDDATEAVTMKKGAESLASIEYAQNKDSQVTKAITKGLPGEEKPAFTYDEDGRLTKAFGVKYAYDAADNATGIGASTFAYDAADELEKGTASSYSYDELGERTKSIALATLTTTYGYDQAGNLTSVSRPKVGETPPVEDGYAYGGDGLRASQTVSASTSYLTWDLSEGLPLILSDTANSYIYGPGGVPVEQINNGSGTVTYLHHDQAGSTRLLTGSTGKMEATFTYGAYGELTGSTGTATTPLGYDGQYTSSDTGLVYLRSRIYDPKTAQFLTVDPLEMYTGAPYNYAGDNPLNYGDPRGLAGESVGENPSCPPGICFPFPNAKETERAIEAAKELGHEIGHTASEVGHGIESVWNEVTGEGESNNESTQTEQSSECGEELRFNGDQDALIKIAKEAQRNGLSPEDAEALREWAEEYDVPFRGPEEHPSRGFGSQPHVHVGPVDHIPVG